MGRGVEAQVCTLLSTTSAPEAGREIHPTQHKREALSDAPIAAMSTAARRRLMRDFKRMQSDPPEGVNGAPLDNDIMQWQAVIFGPEDTAWEVCVRPRRSHTLYQPCSHNPFSHAGRHI